MPIRRCADIFLNRRIFVPVLYDAVCCAYLAKLRCMCGRPMGGRQNGPYNPSGIACRNFVHICCSTNTIITYFARLQHSPCSNPVYFPHFPSTGGQWNSRF